MISVLLVFSLIRSSSMESAIAQKDFILISLRDVFPAIIPANPVQVVYRTNAQNALIQEFFLKIIDALAQMDS